MNNSTLELTFNSKNSNNYSTISSIKLSDYFHLPENFQQVEKLKNKNIVKIELTEFVTDLSFPPNIYLDYQENSLTCDLKQSGTSKICKFSKTKTFDVNLEYIYFRNMNIKILNLDGTPFFNNNNQFDQSKNYFRLKIKVFYN
jgi:hypothetical protein